MREISLPARLYLLGVYVATAAVAVPALARLGGSTHGWVAFTALAVGGALTALASVAGARAQVYNVGSAFTLASIFLLPLELVVLLGLAQVVTAWRLRPVWHVTVFNVCNWTLGLVASLGALEATERATSAFAPAGLAHAAGVLAAVATNVTVPGAALTIARHLAEGRPLREVGFFDASLRSVEASLGFVAVVLAEVWRHDPWLAPCALVPVLLVQRSMHVPKLEEQVRLDPKTGLFNARHFDASLAGEFARAERNDRPLSVLVADLDLLREINNAHGHLAGDAVLAGVADVFRTVLRRGDLAARFGGEEFAILLPDTPLHAAFAVAERLRAAVASTLFAAPTSGRRIRATLSVGVACRRPETAAADALLHEADVAVYRAKARGRNQVAVAGDEPAARAA